MKDFNVSDELIVSSRLFHALIVEGTTNVSIGHGCPHWRPFSEELAGDVHHKLVSEQICWNIFPRKLSTYILLLLLETVALV